MHLIDALVALVTSFLVIIWLKDNVNLSLKWYLLFYFLKYYAGRFQIFWEKGIVLRIWDAGV